MMKYKKLSQINKIRKITEVLFIDWKGEKRKRTLKKTRLPFIKQLKIINLFKYV